MKRKYFLSPILLLVVVYLFSYNDALAQSKVKEEKRFVDKVFFGGSIGLVFGQVTRIDILPQVGMWVIPQWSIGLGGRYTYRKERTFFGGESNPYQAHIWGLSGFTQILPIPDLDEAFKIGIKGGIVFHGEWEGLYLNSGWVHMIMAGFGYRVPVGDRAAVNFLVLWDFTKNTYSPYTTNPIIRLSINF